MILIFSIRQNTCRPEIMRRLKDMDEQLVVAKRIYGKENVSWTYL